MKLAIKNLNKEIYEEISLAYVFVKRLTNISVLFYGVVFNVTRGSEGLESVLFQSMLFKILP